MAERRQSAAHRRRALAKGRARTPDRACGLLFPPSSGVAMSWRIAGMARSGAGRRRRSYRQRLLAVPRRAATCVPGWRASPQRGAVCSLPVVVQRHAPLVFRSWRPRRGAAARHLEHSGSGRTAPHVTPDIVIAPVSASMPACYRLGYGGGFFDRTLGRPAAPTALHRRRLRVSRRSGRSIRKHHDVGDGHGRDRGRHRQPCRRNHDRPAARRLQSEQRPQEPDGPHQPK